MPDDDAEDDDDDGEDDANGIAYASHWDDVYRTDAIALARREWHVECAECVDACAAFIAAAPRDGAVVDVGCGSSTIGVRILNAYGFRALALADVSATLTAKLAKDFAADARVRVETTDARDMSAVVAAGAASVVIDKGTLDALNGERDKRRALRECARMLAKDGCVVSVSFPAAARLKFLERESAKLGLTLRFKVLADGDPARGHRAVFVSVMYKKESAVMAAVPFETDALTAKLTARVRRSNSLYEDADDDEDGVVAPTLDFSKNEEL